ncbi:MAG: response regulator [Candidatus Thiodiazotropha sp.]|jgi:two-component system, cell cycle response regulator
MAYHALNGPLMNTQDKPVILIADDSRVVRVSLKNILKNDCQLIEAEDGQQAWELLLETPHIQLIISDLSMPRIDGRGLLRKIRSSEINRIRNIPFIVVTGNEQESGVREELQDMGATEVVSKPFDPASIVSFVSTLVARQESESYMLLPEDEAQTQHLSDALDQKDFMQTASKELSFAIRNKNELAIALLRIDQYDQLESHYSETAIDHILMTTAEVIRQHIHPDDTMAYFGSGLFAILRPASNAIGTRYIGRRVLEDMCAKQFYLGNSDDIVSISIGISAPQIKPGIRLRELLLLAEGRLKAAMDLGGNRVIDKGNETLTPVSLPSDSVAGLSIENESTSHLNSDAINSSHLKLDAASDRRQRSKTVDPRELEEKIEQLRSRNESLSHENKDLQNQIERWRKQSGESEQLRRRIFELESEQQQIQLKLNELTANNKELKTRAEEAESERQKFIDGEDDQNITLKQANQFYEQENVRLEGQIDALNNRAQKAELAFRKSEQLVVSLKDNIKLLRSQLEQSQRQLAKTRKQASQSAPAKRGDSLVTGDTDPVIDADTHRVDVNSQITNRPESNLLIDGFPSSSSILEDPSPAPVVQLFAEPSMPTATAKAPTPATSTPPSQVKPAPIKAEKSSKPENPFQSIPAYRPEPQEEKFKESRPTSSFAIASLIMLLLLGLGGGYLYFYWQEDSELMTAKTAGVESTAALIPASSASKALAEPSPAAPIGNQGQGEQPRKAAPKKSPTASITEKPKKAEPSAQIASPTPQTDPITDEEARLQAELTLRQIAEEEFRLRLQQVDQSAPSEAPPEAAGNLLPLREVDRVEPQPSLGDEAVAAPAVVEQMVNPDDTVPPAPTTAPAAAQPSDGSTNPQSELVIQ